MPESVLRVPFSLLNRSNEPISGDLRYLPGAGRLAVVVVLHGFMAFKDWGWFPLVCEKLACAGFAVVIFNYSRNGVRQNPDRITDLQSFRQNTITHELGDVGVVLEAVQDGVIGADVIDRGRLMLLGHSRGGGLAIVTAAADQRVRALVTWSSVAAFDRWTSHQKQQWRASGYLSLSNDTTMNPLSLGIGLLEDVEQNREKLDLLRAASMIHVPWLILHGAEDLVVRFSEAEQLYAAAHRSTATLMPLETVGHTLGGSEPEAEDGIDRAVEATILWMKKVPS